jgi:hypothetical protein
MRRAGWLRWPRWVQGVAAEALQHIANTKLKLGLGKAIFKTFTHTLPSDTFSCSS